MPASMDISSPGGDRMVLWRISKEPRLVVRKKLRFLVSLVLEVTLGHF